MKKFILLIIAGLAMSGCSVKKKSAETATVHQVKTMRSADSSSMALTQTKNAADNSKTASTDSSHTNIDEDIDMEFTIDSTAKLDKHVLAQSDSAADSRFMDDVFSHLLKSSSKVKVHINRKTSQDKHSSTQAQKDIRTGSAVSVAKKTGGETSETDKLKSTVKSSESTSAGSGSFMAIIIIVIIVALVYLVQKFSLITWFTNLFKKQ